MGKSFKSANAYEQLFYILANPQFTQRQMARDIDVPHGSKITSFIGWLEELGYVSRSYDIVTKTKAYSVKSPLSLIDFFSRYRKMEDLKLDSFELGTDRPEVMKYLKSKGAIFCLTTSLGYYDEYFRDPLLHVYLPDSICSRGNFKKNEWKCKS